MNDLKNYRFLRTCNYPNGVYFDRTDTNGPDIRFNDMQPIFSKISDDISNSQICRWPGIFFGTEFITIENDFYHLTIDCDEFKISVNDNNDKWNFKIVEKSYKPIVEEPYTSNSEFLMLDFDDDIKKRKNKLKYITPLDDLIQKYTDFFSIFDPDNKLITYLLLINVFKNDD